ncbi:hypothetical protein E1176_00680 [Fulvivirga sp. RKSG066]|uniref:hypothetical protein n=1 Tax=Fulvivirga aurantia TaxID=2529383 RepID=UPI0016291CD1|nr:hypothetical protein [Fulvivirga aurantia]MTI19525.1 hypothetical protein [Fulvivirga aurantia]
MVLSTLSLIASASLLLFDGIVVDEGGIPTDIISYELGYWMWLTSSGVMALVTLILMVLKRLNNETSFN